MAERVRTRRGMSLAKGPAGIIGLICLAYGVIGLIFFGHSFTAHPMNGTVNGPTWLGIEGNGWTNLLIAVGGLLLLMWAPMHWGAKTMSLIVGGAFIAACILAVIDGADVFGIFAANNWTKLAWGIAGAVLILVAMMPRVGKRDEVIDDRRDTAAAGGRFRRNGTAEPVDREPAATTTTGTTGTTGTGTTRRTDDRI
jgi:Domain of unknown function (DUF4383)